MRVDLLTREYPPEVYGGAGVHVEYLARELRKLRRRPGPLHGRHRGTRRASRRTPTPADLVGANPALRTLGTDLAMAAGLRGQRRRALAHLVRQPRRPRRQAAARRAARDDGAQPRAAAAVEGRAARRRLRPVVLGRADGDRGRRRGRRRVGRHARRPAPLLSRASTPAGSTSCTTASTPRSTSPTPRTDVLRAARHRPRPAVGGLRRADHPAEGPAPPAARGPVPRPVRAARALRRRAGHRGDPAPR